MTLSVDTTVLVKSALSIFFFSLTLFSSPLQAETITLPALVGQTGASATFGKGELAGYQLAVEEWNAKGGVGGKQVQLKIEDTKTSQKEIITALNRLAMDKPAVVLGPTWLDGYQGVVPVAKRQDILLVTPSAAYEAFTPETQQEAVTFYHNSTIEVAALYNGLIQRGFQKIALIYEQEPFSEMIRTLLSEHVKEYVADIGVQGGESDFKTMVAKIRTLNPDVLVVLVWNEKSLLSLLQQVKVQLPDLQLATLHDGEGWLSTEEFRPLLPKLIYCKFEVANSEFAAKFKARFGFAPLLTASNAYDAANAVLSALNSGAKTAADIREYLRTQALDTVTFGKFTFAGDGRVPSRVAILEH